MDALKALPQAFFDFIARVVPGAVLLVTIELLRPGTWATSLMTFSGGMLGKENAFPFVALFAVSASYVLGQLLSPFGRFADTAVQFSARLKYRQGPKAPKWPLPTQEVWEHYDWLRVCSPREGGLVVKIRAEYTMFNSLAAALGLVGVLGLFIRGSDKLTWALLTIAVVMGWRAWSVQTVFVKSVTNLRSAVLAKSQEAKRLGPQP